MQKGKQLFGEVSWGNNTSDVQYQALIGENLGGSRSLQTVFCDQLTQLY